MYEMQKINFGLKRFESSKDKDFNNALMIYNDTIPVDTKTRTNEIIYFADHCKMQPNREMFFFGLYVNNVVIGFIEAGYLKNSKTIIIDYIVIKDEYRLNSVFYPLFSLLQRFFSEQMIDYNYIVTEVSTKTLEESVDSESFFSRKMLQIEDFRLIKALYFQPKLGIKNEESNFKFQLMIKSSQPLTVLKKSTYLDIVQDIFLEHYQSWYQVVDPENAELYAAHIQEQYELVEKELDNIEIIELVTQTPVCDYYKAPDCHYNCSTAGFIPKKNTKSRPILLIGIPLVTIGVYFISLHIFQTLTSKGITPDAFAPIFAAVAAIFTSIFTIAFTRISKQ